MNFDNLIQKDNDLALSVNPVLFSSFDIDCIHYIT